jgi:parallel beta-helix repeat protein
MPVLYYVAVSDNSEFPYENENSGWIGDDNWLAPELPEGVWYWRVRARDNAGNVGDNMIGSFRVDTLVPGLLWPPDGLRTPDNTLTLSWENWRPADNFEVWVDNDSDFSAPEVLENSTENVYALPLELPDGTYYWRVRAYAGATVGPWPMTRNFTIDVPPSAPIHIEGDLEFTPANGVVAGSGTPGDPYIIENWVIDASPTDYGVLIEDTTRHFILRNSTIYEGEWAGVRFEGVLNGRVENVVLSRNGYGIYLLSSDNNVIIDVVSENNREKGIYLSSSDNNTLENSTLRNNGSEFFGGEGISLWSSHRNLISNIVSENNSDGIELDEGSSYNTIENSTFENNRSAGISIDWSHNNVFENNISKNNDWSGIYLYYSNHVILENNLIENNSTGILLRYSENARLSNNRLDNNTYGFGVEGGVFSTFDHDIDNSNLVNGKPIIYLIGENDITINQDNQAGYLGLINCENVRVENLPFENNHQGILLAHASGVSFENNAISSNYYGMYVSGSDNIVIENSVIDNNYYGIQLDSSENFSFENGTITNSSRGFYAVYPRRAKLRNSTFSRNQFGVYLMYGDNSSLENNLFENNFVDIYLYTENTTMRNNQLENSWYDFIVFGYSISNFIHDIDNTNLIDGKPIIYLIGENDFVVSQDNTLGYLGLVNCDNVRVENLMFENTGQPIMLAGTTNSWIENISADNSVAGISLWVSSDNNMILNNAFRYDYYGVYIVGSNGNVLNGNTSENSSYGIYLYNSHNNTLINNRCENNGTGIYLSGADNNLIKNNVCQNNDEGISLSGADNNLIKNNVCQNNSEHDIGCSWSYGNTFEANTYSTFTGIPGISGVAASSVTQSSATIIWTTAAPSNSVVEYGTTTAYGLTSSDASMVTSHSIGLSGLSAGTTYHYRVRSTDGNNNTEISGDYTFTTQAAPPPSPKTNTSLTIDPESFTLASGQSITLTATLVDAENNPLADKTISWNEANDRGSFSVTSATTDENGRASVVYTAPSVTEDENITITASFTGDEVYNGSSGTSRGLISPLPPASTFLAIEPETFDLVSGATLTLVATLTDEDGIPLAGKTIEWSESTSQNGVTWTLPVALGSSVTNSEGRASITYTAREVDVKTRVRITAAFEGDNEYQKSSAVSLGVIIPSEVAEKLEYLIEKLEDRTRELEIEVENEHLEEVGNAFLEDDLGAVISINIVAGVPIIENDYQHPDIEISVEVEIGEIVEVRVSSELPYGKTILVHIDRQTLPVTKLEDLVVLLDGENVGFAVNYGDALDPTDENVPEFLVMFGAEGIQVLVSIPGFTERTITIAVYPTVPIVGFPPLHVVALVAIVLLFAILAVIWRRIGAGAKGVQGV